MEIIFFQIVTFNGIRTLDVFSFSPILEPNKEIIHGFPIENGQRSFESVAVALNLVLVLKI